MAIGDKKVDMWRIDKVSKSFGLLKAVNDVSFEVKAAEVVGLLGPNGAGKTTLMRILTGFYRGNRGTIFYHDTAVDTKSKDYKKLIGYLPENNPLYLAMTVTEYLEFVAKLKQVVEIKKGILEAALECGLLDMLNKKIDTLSKGYRQRVGLAAALLGDPRILVLDEPTSGLDPKQIVEIRKLIRTLARKKAVILSTHILTEAKEICDRILIINRGNLVLNEKTDKIKNIEKRFIELTD